MAMQNLGSSMGLGFPISNYSMTLALLERVDFWDTTEDAIGEDFHMFVKAYFKTHGQASALPVPLPMAYLRQQIPSVPSQLSIISFISSFVSTSQACSILPWIGSVLWVICQRHINGCGHGVAEVADACMRRFGWRRYPRPSTC